jgi:Uri superfamily endonuclease
MEEILHLAKGSYILLIQLPEEKTIAVGSLKDIYFPPGYYAYVGSAMGGLKSRLSHHLKEIKRTRWHIDYLLQEASITGIVICQTKDRVECAIAQALNHQFDSIPGFGCSDCHCHSHLFLATKEMKSEIMVILNRLSIQSRLTEGIDIDYLSTSHP